VHHRRALGGIKAPSPPHTHIASLRGVTTYIVVKYQLKKGSGDDKVAKPRGAVSVFMYTNGEVYPGLEQPYIPVNPSI